MRLITLPFALFLFVLGCSPVPRTLTLRVPHKSSPENLCVPTSASMVLAYYGEEYTPEKLKELAGYRTDFGGTYFTDMVNGLKKIGYEWQIKGFPRDHIGFEAGLDEIIRNIVDKRPVLISTTPQIQGHTMVVVGYDKTRKVVEVMDPAGPGSWTMSFDKLENIWHEDAQLDQTSRWIITTWPKSN